jgi:hypothetical protein
MFIKKHNDDYCSLNSQDKTTLHLSWFLSKKMIMESRQISQYLILLMNVYDLINDLEHVYEQTRLDS